MSTAAETNDQAIEDALGMSDEAFAEMDPSAFEQDFDAVADEDTADNEDTGDDELDTDTGEGEEDSDDADDSAAAEADSGEEDSDTDEDEETDTDDSDDAEANEDADSDEEDTDGEDDSDESDEDSEDDSDEDSDKDEIDYKAEYEKLLAPFKANGKEMKVDNADEAIQLMQMGANYNKKMAALKPSLKTLKTLEKNSLLDQDKLNHLIDLSKGDKGAIQKLLKDSGIDPLDLDASEESDYTPNSHTVDDRELALDDTLETLQESPTFAQTVNTVNGWDGDSQNVVANNPQLLQVIDSHMASGIYERVSSAVEKERTFGRLNGLSDLEAYRQVGDRLHEQGAFDDLVQPNPRQEQKAPAAEKQVVRRKKPKAPDPKTKQKKRAASSTKAKPASSQPTDYNPLSMSDEEFEKQVNENLL